MWPFYGARARICVWRPACTCIVPTWGELQLGFRVMADWALRDVHRLLWLAPCRRQSGCHVFSAFCSSSLPLSFTSFICCHCHDFGAGRIATTIFGTRRAAELHISSSACVNLKLLARVSGVSPLSTETPSGPRTKRLDRLDRLDSHGGLCGRRGGGCPEVNISASISNILVIRRQESGMMSLLLGYDVRISWYCPRYQLLCQLRYLYILIFSPISALTSATTSGTSLIS